MDIEQLTERPLAVHALYDQLNLRDQGHTWTRVNRPCGPDALGHELPNCLWDVIVLARLHYVDLAAEFHRMTDDLERALTARLNPADLTFANAPGKFVVPLAEEAEARTAASRVRHRVVDRRVRMDGHTAAARKRLIARSPRAMGGRVYARAGRFPRRRAGTRVGRGWSGRRGAGPARSAGSRSAVSAQSC